MIRRIIQIDKEKCTGCGICAAACHEGAIGMVEGKARLLRDDYCDGLGDCLPACPTGAITFVEREAAAYDEAAVQQHMAQKKTTFHGCPGSATKLFQRTATPAGAGTIPSPLGVPRPLCLAHGCRACLRPSSCRHTRGQLHPKRHPATHGGTLSRRAGALRPHCSGC